MAQRESDIPITVEEADGRSATVSAQPVAGAEGPIQSGPPSAPHTMIGFGVPVDTDAAAGQPSNAS